MADLQPARTRLPAWVPWAGSIVSSLGLIVSVYLTYDHYASSSLLACPERGLINCAKVTTSVYANFFGVPLAVLGLFFFVLMLFLQLPRAWRSSSLIKWVRLAAAGGGVIMVLYLVYAELFLINAICLYCTVVHVLTLMLFALTAFGTALASD